MFLKNLKNVKKKYMVVEIDASILEEIDTEVKKFQNYFRSITGGSFSFFDSLVSIDSLPRVSDNLESGCYLYELYELDGCCYESLKRVKKEKSYVEQTKNNYNYFNRNENKYLDGYELKGKVSSNGVLSDDGINLLNLPDDPRILKRVLFFDTEEEALLLANLKDGEFKKIREIPSEIDALLSSAV